MLAYVIFAGVFTFFACLMAGRLLLSGLSIDLYREEERFLSFFVGSGLLSAIVFLLTAAHLAYLEVFHAAEHFEPLSLFGNYCS